MGRPASRKTFSAAIAVRFNEEVTKLLRFITMVPNSKYSSLADFVREAVDEKIEKEDLMKTYGPLLAAFEQVKEAVDEKK